MAALIIDGYNVIGVMHKDLEGERQRLIDMLIEYRKAKGHDITVVFDGWKDGSHSETRIGMGGITVIYSALGTKADAVIKRIISEERKAWIVISSDRDIAAHAWAEGSTPIKSEDFMDIIEGEESGAPAKRGTLSKKEKAIARAMAKL